MICDRPFVVLTYLDLSVATWIPSRLFSYSASPPLRAAISRLSFFARTSAVQSSSASTLPHEGVAKQRTKSLDLESNWPRKDPVRSAHDRVCQSPRTLIASQTRSTWKCWQTCNTCRMPTVRQSNPSRTNAECTVKKLIKAIRNNDYTS